MYKIIGEDAIEYGPVSEEQIWEWLAEGRAHGETKARREGEGEWVQLAAMPEFAAHFRPRGRWRCSKCGEEIEPQFDTCWKCSTPRSAALPVAGSPPAVEPAPPASAVEPRWRVKYQVFRGTFASWDQLFREASEFATEIGRERLIGISHSEDENDGVVAVWYWSQDSQEG